ncbi:MAG TPA: exodeoxyribonuclease VII small subunit [Planctomycetaceae bacterium]|nr:exodeoxyribonuclease VII small subunit [Planctomycetaceae bacterium]
MKNDQDDPAGREPESELAAGAEQPLRKSRSPKATSRPRRFEAALDEIEVIVLNLERGELDLGESLAQYQKGIETLKECHQLLSDAERRITLLSGFDADGNPVSTSFDESDMSLDEKQAKRGSRRTAQRTPGRQAITEGDEDFGEAKPGLF